MDLDRKPRPPQHEKANLCKEIYAKFPCPVRQTSGWIKILLPRSWTSLGKSNYLYIFQKMISREITSQGKSIFDHIDLFLGIRLSKF